MSTNSIEGKILTQNLNTFFLPTGKSYSASYPDFIKFVKLYGLLELKSDNTLYYNKTDLDGVSGTSGQIVMYYNPTPVLPDRPQAYLDFLNNETSQYFDVVLDKFFFTANGMIYAAKDENNIFQVYINKNSTDEYKRDYYKLDTNLRYNKDHLFTISYINIPQSLTLINNTADKYTLQSIWNPNLIYGQIEKELEKNTNDIRFGWYCQTGNYTRKDGVYMDCDDDTLGRFCDGDSGREFLFDSDSYGYRCRSYTGQNPTCGDEAHEKQMKSGENGNRIWCQYGDWGLSSPYSYDNKFGPEITNACAEGIGNLNALPRSTDNTIINANKLSYRKCKLTYPHTAAEGETFNLPIESWSPWSKSSSESEVYYNFCAEHDTVSNLPRYIRNSNCIRWLSDDSPNRLNKLKDLYAKNYPNTIIKIDCVLGDWGECINGKQSRKIIVNPLNGGKACEELTRSCTSSSNNKTSKVFIIIIILVIIVLFIYGIYIYKKSRT